MPRWIAFALLILIPVPPFVRGELQQYVDNATILAGEADLTKIDPAALEQFLRQAMAAASLTGNSPTAIKPAEVDGAMAMLNGRLNNLIAVGGKQIYIVTQVEVIKEGGLAVIVPAAPGGDAKKIASMLFSGKVNGPTSAPANPQGRGPRYTHRAEVIGGNVAVYGTESAINYVKNLKPIDRPEIAAGLAALGDSPVKVVVAPPLPVRMMLNGFWPKTIFEQPTTVITNDVLYLAAGATLPPNPTVKVIAQSTEPAKAQALDHIVTYGLAAISGVPPTISPDLAKLLTPEVKNDQLLLTADSAKLLAMAKEVAIPLAQSRRQAIRMAAMNNMRQILMSCVMYAADHKGAYPDDLKGLDKYLGAAAKMVLTNPMQPNVSPGFIYVKPPARAAGAADRMILYAAYKDFGSGVCVGFMDGHVEFVTEKQRFDDLVAKTAMDEAPQ